MNDSRYTVFEIVGYSSVQDSELEQLANRIVVITSNGIQHLPYLLPLHSRDTLWACALGQMLMSHSCRSSVRGR